MALGTKTGWGGRIRTSAWRNQNPLPYRLATPQLTYSSKFKEYLTMGFYDFFLCVMSWRG